MDFDIDESFSFELAIITVTAKLYIWILVSKTWPSVTATGLHGWDNFFHNDLVNFPFSFDEIWYTVGTGLMNLKVI